jgi:site-specific recombinase XerD
MKVQDMTQRYRKFQRSWGTWYAFDNATGNSVSLKTRTKAEAVQKINAMNETERQPGISLGLARVYLNATDPKLATRTWQDVMENIITKKADETLIRWQTAIKDKNFDCLRSLKVVETRPEHFDRVLADGKVSSNVYLRRIHNHALGMDWLLKSVIPRLQWPKPVFKTKRAITAEEHAAIIEREHNAERRDFYELLWQTGAAQSDGACLRAENINWEARTICFTRKKLKGRANIKPTLFRFSADIKAILKRRPTEGQLFPYLCIVRAGDRATEFKQRCDGLAISGVSLHSYRYAWAERALKCGFPERFAQQALGHNSKAVHRAYAKHAEVTVPSLADWEIEWKKNPQRIVQPRVLPMIIPAGHSLQRARIAN